MQNYSEAAFTLVVKLRDFSKIATFGCKLLSNYTQTPSKHRQKNRLPECDFSKTSRCFRRNFAMLASVNPIRRNVAIFRHVRSLKRVSSAVG